jgi:hypothetical protein
MLKYLSCTPARTPPPSLLTPAHALTQVMQVLKFLTISLSRARALSQDKALARMGITPSRKEALQKEPGTAGTAGVGRGRAELPGGWASAVDPATGRTYYYNAEGETSWERPV